MRKICGMTLERKDILEENGWPSLQCQKCRLFSVFLTELKLYKRL